MTKTKKKIYRPCNTCAFEHNCVEEKGCRQWKAYFRAYWRALRRRAFGILILALSAVEAGLQDKNGKRIFEGDIVCLDAATNAFWAFVFGACGGVQNVWHEVGYMGFYLRPLSEKAIQEMEYGQRDDPIYYLNALRLHIIGNIHDNPELLGGAE